MLIIYIALGDRVDGYNSTSAKAMALERNAEGFAIQMFEELFYRRLNPEFPHYCIEYYQSCEVRNNSHHVLFGHHREKEE